MILRSSLLMNQPRIWSKFELGEETEKDIKSAVEQLVRERIDVEELGGVAVDCFVLKGEGEWYATYSRLFGRPPPGSSKASVGRAKTWEVAFKYNLESGIYEVMSFSEVNFLLPEDVEQKAVTIGKEDGEIKALVTENAENSLTSRAARINRHEGIVRLEYAAALLLNETHALYKGLTASIDVEGEEVLFAQTQEGVWYAPGLRATEAPPPGLEEIFEMLEMGTSITTTDAIAGASIEYYGLSPILAAAIAIASGTLLAIRKTKGQQLPPFS